MKKVFTMHCLFTLQAKLPKPKSWVATILCCSIFIMLLSPGMVSGQIAITNTTAVTQNFDTLSAVAAAPLPFGWKMSVAGANPPSWSAVGNFTATNIQASSGSPATGGRYNWGNGTTTTDRSLGYITSGGYASPNSIMVQYVNNNPAPINSLSISYDLERYRINTAAATVSFYYSTDGTNWNLITSSSFSTGASSYTFTTPGLTQVSGASTGTINIANSSSIYLRWDFATGTSSQGIGLDNVNVTATFAGSISTNSTGMAAVNTTYGTASPTPASFTVTGTNVTQATGVTVTPPAGYEVSLTSGTGYATSINVGAAGNFGPTPVYVRLAATTNAGTYSGNIVCTSTGLTPQNVATVSSTVAQRALTITASGVSKNYGVTITGSAGSTAFTTGALANGETISTVTVAYGTGSGALATPGVYNNSVTASSPVGTGSFAVSNYSITYVPGAITVNAVAPTVASPTATAITSTSATLGANVTSDGSGSGVITARGTSFKTSSPVAATDNQLAEGGTTTGVYTHLRTLTPQTHYWYVGYATNGQGTSISAEGNFYTLSSPATVQAANITATASSYSQIDIAWDAATFPASGATVKGYVLLRATGSTPTLSSANGTAPAAGTGVIVSSTIIDPAISFSNTALAQNTSYTYLLVPYTWDGTNAATYNYLKAGALTVTAATPLGPCTPPGTAPTTAVVNGATASSLNISWTAGSGTNSWVIVRAGGAVNQTPVTGTAYTASAVFGSGDNLGSLNFVCYNGTGTSFTLTNLSATTTYYVAVYTYNVSGYCFNTTTAATGNNTTLAAASMIETFEPGTKNSYTSGSDLCNLGNWNFNNALIGTTAGSDRFNGAKSARIQSTGSVTMLFDKANGLGTVSLKHALFSSDPSTTWRLDVSNDGGATFTAYQSPVQTTNSTTLNTVSFTPNITGSQIRVRVVKLTGGTSSRLNIDDITLGDYISTNTVTTSTIAGSPFCITNTTGATVNVPFTSTGVFATGNVYTTQLSDETGSFALPLEIGTLTSSANSGTIVSSIPAGTITSSAYKIRVVASNPAIIGSASATTITINLNTPEVTNVYSGPANNAVTVGWTNPVGCYNDILVMASTSSVTCTPSGTSYPSSSVYGSGTACSGSFAVYQGTGASVNVTGLINGVTYYFKVFVRNGTTWSNGVQITAVPTAVATGDYQSRTSGLYSDVNTWEKWNGTSWTSPSPDIPGTGNAGTANVTIRNGHTVTISTSAPNLAIKNLTIISGGTFYGTSATNTYITIYGDINCNGIIGQGTSTFNSLSFNIEGVNSTISGTGTFNASRIRKNFTVNPTTNLIIAMNVNLLWNSSSGTTMYNNVDGTTFNVTVNQNATLSAILTTGGTSGTMAINGVTGTAGNKAGTYTINGTMNIPGILYATSNNPNAGRSCNWIIGATGVINCNQINSDASGAGGHTFTIQNGGRLNINTNVGFNTTTASSFSLTNNTFSFQAGSIVQYSATSGITHVLTDLTYSNLVISGSGTKDLIRSDLATTGLTLTVNRNLTIGGSSTLDVTGSPANNINLGKNWTNWGTAGFTESISTVTFNGISGSQKINCPGGENFYNLSVSNTDALGVELNTDVTVANDFNLGTNGRFFFGITPSIMRLTKMSTGSNSFVGSGTALVDMSQSASTLYIGCQSPSFSGTFAPGTMSLVNYDRDNAISLSGGTQNILTAIPYANLSVSGSDTKITNGSFTVGGKLTVDGATTSLEANTVSSVLTLGGDLTLSGGGTMGGTLGTSCLNNLSITTAAASAALSQTFNGGLNPVNCFNLNTTKTANGIILTTGNTNLVINNTLTQSTAASLTPNDNRVRIGNAWSIWGSGGFVKGTSTVEYSGAVPQTVIAIDYFNLESSSTGTRTMASAGTIGVAGTFTPFTNVYTFTGSTVDYNGTGAQNIAPFTAAATVGHTYDNLTVSNTGTKSLTGSTDVEGALTLNNSIQLTLGNNYLNLKSTATKTARVAPVSATATITYGTGRFVVERFFPGKRSWRLITAPVSIDAAKTVFNSWQVGGNKTLSGNGTYVTGLNETTTNGFDVSPLHNYSLKTFNQTNSQFDPVLNTKTKLISGTAATATVPDNIGYFMFVRGDRTTANAAAFYTYGTVNTTTLRDTGRIQVQSYTFPANTSTGANRYTLIGNPYASPVDFASLARVGVANKFQAWDPNLNTVGGYVTVDLSSGSAVVVPVGSAQTQHIQSKQAFLVETTNGTSPSVTFAETGKSTTNSLSLFRPITPTTPSLAANLHIVNADGSTTLADGVLAQYDESYSMGTDQLDAVRFGNVNETFSIANGNEFYMLERRPPLAESDTLFFNLRKTRQLQYRFNFMPNRFVQPNMTAFLEDSYLKTSTQLNTANDSWIDFEMNGNTASAAANRFRMVFKKTLSYSDVKASVINTDVAVQWTATAETAISNYEIERSADGNTFTSVGTANALGSSHQVNEYNWLDKDVTPGIYYYRIKANGTLGSVEYSMVVKVKVTRTATQLYVYPNPVTDGILNLQMSKQPAGIYTTRLLSENGQSFFTKQIIHNVGVPTETISYPAALTSGNYKLEVTGPDKTKTVVSILIQKQ